MLIDSINADVFVTLWSILYCLNYSHSMVAILEALYFLTVPMYHMQLASHRMLVHFLPTYSPDLNPIVRSSSLPIPVFPACFTI